MTLPRILRGTGLLVVAALAVAGCTTQAQSAPAAPAAPQVPVVLAEERDILPEGQFTGRVQAIDRVELRARVSGALEAVLFREGATVRAGTPLFKLDRRPFEIAVRRAAGELAAADAQLRRAVSELQRAERLMQEDAIAREELIRRQAEVETLSARVDAARAAHADALLNLDFTLVHAPVTGRVGRAEVTPGNLIVGGPVNGTELTRIHSIDPIHVYFDLDPGTADAARMVDSKSWRAFVSAFGSSVEGDGAVDFIDNGVSAQSGTLRVRARIRNPEGTLLPDAVVKVRFTYGRPERKTVIPDVAIAADQASRTILVVDGTGRLEQRSVTPMAKAGPWRVVSRESVRPGEPVVLPGRPGLRPGMTVISVPEVLR